MIPPTGRRRYHDAGHFPPNGKHSRGREQAATWKGTSRIVDRPGRRRANARSWAARRGRITLAVSR